MKMNRLISAACAIVTLAGCTTVEPLDGVKRTPKESVEVFFAANPPAKPYKIIATFSDRANPGKDEQAHRTFVNKAKQLGADGVILEAAQAGGFEVGPMGSSTKAVYRGVAFVWK